MSSLSPVSEMRLSTGALALHEGSGELRVLVGGLGLGYTAQAALQDPRVACVHVMEKMDFIIDWMRSGLLPLSQELMADKRLEILKGDVYATLLGPASTIYDLILIDVDHSPQDLLSPESAPFYTRAGQRQVEGHLRPGGVLGVWSAFDDDAFAHVLAASYHHGHREEVSWPDEELPASHYDNLLFFARRASEG